MPTESAVKSSLLPVDEAMKRILEGLPQKPPEAVSVLDAHGRVLAEPLRSRMTLPSQALSAMDGYAVRAIDCTKVPTNLVRVGEAAAGHPWTGKLDAGQAVRIFTGGVVPDGADAIILQEDVDATAEADGADITIREAAQAGKYIRPAGLDANKGDLLLDAGMTLSARGISLALATGNVSVICKPRPTIGVLSTGDELVRPGETPGPGQIISSNAFYLQAFIRACGGKAVDLGIARDKPGALRDAVEATNEPLDLIVTTGGASVGVHDHVVDDLGQKGSHLNFWKIAMRPGKPLIFGVLGDVPLLGLPGNPVSSAVCTLVFLQPAIAHLAGTEFTPEIFSARLGVALSENDQRQDYLRARFETSDDALPLIIPAQKQDSSMISVFANSTCLLIRPPFDPARQPGDIVTAMTIPPLL